MQTHGIVESEAPGPISKPANLAPAGTTDTHFHIFGPTVSTTHAYLMCQPIWKWLVQSALNAW